MSWIIMKYTWWISNFKVSSAVYFLCTIETAENTSNRPLHDSPLIRRKFGIRSFKQMLLQSYLVDIHKFMNNIIWRLKYFYNWGKNNLNFRRTGMFSFPLNLSNTFCKYFINSWNMKEKVKEYFNGFHQYNYEQFQYYVLFESAVNLQNWTTFLWISNVCISLSFRWQMIFSV